MKKLNRVYVYTFSIVLIIFLFVGLSNYKKTVSYEDFGVFQNSMTSSLIYYSLNNHSKKKYTYQEINSEEIIDFNADKNISSNLENWNVKFFFSNNKMSFLLDSIIRNDSSSLKKYNYITYIEANNLNNPYKLSNKILNNISYLWVMWIDEKYYDYDSYSENDLIEKYFVLSTLKNKWYNEVTNFENKIFDDIKRDFEHFNDASKLKLLFFLHFNWELDTFIEKIDFDISSISDTNNSYYVYISNIINWNTDERNKIVSNLKNNFNSLNDDHKVLLIWYLYDAKDQDFQKYYDIFEKKNNYNLALWVAFKKYLIYSQFDNEYTSYDNYSKFWYSSWILINRKKEFIINSDNVNHIDEYPLSKVMYDWLIDTRVVSFEWDKIYLNVIVK